MPLRWCLSWIMFSTFLNVTSYGFDIATISLFMLFMRTFSFSVKYSWESPFVKSYALLLGWATISMLWASDPNSAVDTVRSMVRILLAFISTIYIIREKQDVEAFVWACVAGILLTLLSTFVDLPGQIVAEPQEVSGRFSSTGISFNAYSFQLVWAATLVYFYIRYTYKAAFDLRLLLSALFVAVLWFPVIRAGSRAGLIGVLAVPLLFQFDLSTRRAFALLLIIVLTVVFGILSPESVIPTDLPFATEETQARLTTALSGTDETHRPQIWRTGLEIAYHHPLLGTGIGSSGQSYIKYYKNVWDDINLLPEKGGRALHNSFITMWAELGIIGLLLFIRVLYHWIPPITEMKEEYRILTTVFILLILIASTFHSFELITSLMMLLAVTHRIHKTMPYVSVNSQLQETRGAFFHKRPPGVRLR